MMKPILRLICAYMYVHVLHTHTFFSGSGKCNKIKGSEIDIYEILL